MRPRRQDYSALPQPPEMEMRTTMFICRNPYTGKPHAVSLQEIPMAMVDKNDRLREMFQQFKPAEQAAMRQQGTFRAMMNNSFVEEAEAEGMGLIIEKVSLDTKRLNAKGTAGLERKDAIQQWVRERYLPAGSSLGTDAALEKAVNQTYANHITTDMTFSCMTLKHLLDTVARPHFNGKEPGTLTYGTYASHLTEQMMTSLQERGIIGERPDLRKGSNDYNNLVKYHSDVAQMRLAWPSVPDENYGADSQRAREQKSGKAAPFLKEGAVVYYEGFASVAQNVIAAGPHANHCAWPPTEVDEFVRGIPLNETGKRVVKPTSDPLFIYTPRAAISVKIKGQEAVERAVLNFLDLQDKPPNYSASRNCVEQAYRGFGPDLQPHYQKFLDITAGHNDSEKVRNDWLMATMTKKNPPALPGGLNFDQTPYNLHILRDGVADQNAISLAQSYLSLPQATREIITAVAEKLPTSNKHSNNITLTIAEQQAMVALATAYEGLGMNRSSLDKVSAGKPFYDPLQKKEEGSQRNPVAAPKPTSM